MAKKANTKDVLTGLGLKGQTGARAARMAKEGGATKATKKSTSGKMSNFEKAFAAARKQGRSTFTFGGKKYSTKRADGKPLAAPKAAAKGKTATSVANKSKSAAMANRGLATGSSTSSAMAKATAPKSKKDTRKSNRSANKATRKSRRQAVRQVRRSYKK